MATDLGLPAGFALDEATQSAPAGLPPGFQPDNPKDWTWGDVGLAAARGVPIAGGILERNLSPETLAGAKAFDEAHPYISGAAKLAGGTAALGPLGLTGTGARLLGMTGATLGRQVLNSAASGAGIGALDAAARGEDIKTGLETGGAFGAAGPVAGRIIGGAVNGARRLVSPAETDIIPSTQAIKGAASGQYKELTDEAKNIPVAQSVTRAFAGDLKAALDAEGLRPSVADKTHRALDEMNGQGGDLVDLINTKKTLKLIAGGIDKTERQAAMTVLPQIDAKIAELGPELLPKLKTADANWSAAMQAKEIERAIEKGKRNAAVDGSGGNTDNRIRQQFRNIVTNDKRSAGLRPAELAQANLTAAGDTGTNIARKVGKLDPFAGGLSAMLHLGAAPLLGGANIPVAMLGYGARKIAERRTEANARQLAEMIRARSPHAAAAGVPADFFQMLRARQQLPGQRVQTGIGMLSRAAVGLQ